MDKSCLNCRFEPDWGKFSDGEYSRAHGECKYPVPDVKLPACIFDHVCLKMRNIVRYSDNSGVYHHCAVWAPKE